MGGKAVGFLTRGGVGGRRESAEKSVSADEPSPSVNLTTLLRRVSPQPSLASYNIFTSFCSGPLLKTCATLVEEL